MAVKNRAGLKADVLLRINDNTSEEISALDGRNQFDDLIDSLFSLSDDLATSANIRAALAGKLLDAPKIYEAMQPVVLTDAPTVAWDMATGIVFTLTIGGLRTLANPTNVTVGKSGVLRVVQDASGNRTLGLPSNIKMAESGAMELSTAANAEDLYSWLAWSATKIYLFPIGKAFG